MLLAHWTAAAAGGRMPTRDIIDPIKLGELMGWLFVYQVERDPLRFRYLVYGPKIARRIGFDLTGKYVHDHPSAEAREAIANLLSAVVVTGRPHRGASVRRLLDQEATTEAVVLPLAGPDGEVAHLLALQTYDVAVEEPPPAITSGGSTGKTTWRPVEDPAQLDDDRLAKMLALWTEAAAGGRMPTRDLIDAAKLGDLMDWLFVYGVERDPLRFRYLVHSPKVALRMGADFTGRYVDEIPNEEAREAVGKVLTAVLTTGRPHRVETTRRLMDQEVASRVVVMPLAGTDGAIDHLLALQIYDTPGSKPEVRQPPPQLSSPWISASTRTPVEDGSQIRDLRVRLVYSRWLQAVRDGKPPSREIVDSATFGELMDWLFVYKVERDPLRFRYLLYGSKIARRGGIDQTGRYVDEHPHPPTGEAIATLLTLVAESGRPYHALSPRRVLDRDMLTEAVVMPLGGPGGAIDHLLAVQVLDVPEDGDS